MFVLVLGFTLFAGCPGPVTLEPGAPCRSESTAGCEANTRRLLQCVNKAYVVVSDCRGPGGCAEADGAVTCDTSGNTAGDRCPPSSEGKLRCDPDAGVQILRCVDGGLTSVFVCPRLTVCGVTDAGLSCY